MKDLGKKIRDLREARELSPEQLAEKVGFAKSTVWAYESGKKQISVSHLSMLADFFDVSVDSLLDRTEKVIDLSTINDYKILLDNKPLDETEIAEAASYIQVKRRMGSYGAVNS
ncbi:helix-turn-helix transcriptional regulator [Planococcus shenhongbingii]|uniref:Helix-turn-helix transcriptional regulator n=1 Tax=Planococcus shenhongbingii TaxID=3058398 RepID=A0ABT8NB23_9BACL|nr:MULTISPECIES: helix-turn-helix transcriptional regulator [unclassified Planococcus (in: firmicutes)]MDN7245084.1 helix-turn-helix transcriptional regulator [Planococcus sp. N017]WKA58179.1 helix-turn-helix transcriptional regulator [Planococcus sp. N016]